MTDIIAMTTTTLQLNDADDWSAVWCNIFCQNIFYHFALYLK